MDWKAGKFSSRPPIMAALAIAVLGVVAIVAVREIGRTTAGMTPTSMSANQLAGLANGAAAKVVLKVTGDDGIRLTGPLLARHGAAFAESGRDVQVDLGASTQIVMGGAADVRPGAVLEVDGILGPEGRVAARQVIILTGFVKLPPKSSAP